MSSILAWNLIRAARAKRPIPLIVNLQVTKLCNLRCVYCYADLADSRSSPDFSTREIFHQIDDLYQHGTRWIRLMGGEPLMREDIGDIIGYIKKKKIFCELSTNGFLIPKKIKDVRKVDAICLSLDGDEEVTDMMRGRGCYKKVMEGIRACYEEKLWVRFHACITKYTNRNCVDNLARLCKVYGYGFNFAQYSYATKEKERISPCDEQAKELFRVLIEYKRKGYPVMTSFATLKKLIAWPFPFSKIIYPEDIPRMPFAFKRCRYRRLNITLNSDGMIYPCTKLFGYGKNYLEVGMSEALNYLNELKCVLCSNAGELDMNLLLSFDPGIILDGARYMLR